MNTPEPLSLFAKAVKRLLEAYANSLHRKGDMKYALSIMLPHTTTATVEDWFADKLFPKPNELKSLDVLAHGLQRGIFDTLRQPDPVERLAAITESYAAGAEFLTVIGLPTILPSKYAAGHGLDQWNPYVVKTELRIEERFAQSIEEYLRFEDSRGSRNSQEILFYMELPPQARAAILNYSLGLGYAISHEFAEVLFPFAPGEGEDLSKIMERDALMKEWMFNNVESLEVFDRAVSYIMKYYYAEMNEALKIFIRNDGKKLLVGNTGIK